MILGLVGFATSIANEIQLIDVENAEPGNLPFSAVDRRFPVGAATNYVRSSSFLGHLFVLTTVTSHNELQYEKKNQFLYSGFSFGTINQKLLKKRFNLAFGANSMIFFSSFSAQYALFG